ncbi:hypothetical protein Bhyg_05102 [Pseudolycoriella hygida]|uniref:Secreted protein n=1 Tax=Pseudolycoriella hygida TaxID=35572 RepID=A0A9Q0NHM4_9DIPT|nr:hypothetical protein Bhyg_05102 [Pseudolycoriella hygida]
MFSNEKYLLSVGVQLLIFSLLNESSGQLIAWEDYLQNVAKTFIKSLEEREITGSGMPLRDFNATINQTLYDVDAIGTAKFHSGFIAKIDASGILSTSYRSQVVETYSNVLCFVTFDGVQTVYDVDYEYSDFKGRGSLLTWFKQLQFQMQIRRNHTTSEVSSEITLYNTGSQNDYIVKVDPNNGFTQLTAREIKRTIAFREPINDSFKDWTETWKNDLAAAVSAHKFPEICYYCP